MGVSGADVLADGLDVRPHWVCPCVSLCVCVCLGVCLGWGEGGGEGAVTRSKIFKENPYQLIKFKAFKRTQQLDGDGPKIDRRLTRAKNVDNLPIGAWANWIVQSM